MITVVNCDKNERDRWEDVRENGSDDERERERGRETIEELWEKLKADEEGK